jgi:hypothetical protein
MTATRGEVIQNMNGHQWRKTANFERWRREFWLPSVELSADELRLLEDAGCREDWCILGSYKYRLHPNSVTRVLVSDVRTPMFGRTWHPKD